VRRIGSCAAALTLAATLVISEPAAARKAPAVSPEGMHGLGPAARVIEISTFERHTTHATARTYRKVHGHWQKVRPGMSAWIGRNGLNWPSYRHAGDETTPIGNYGFVFDFGSKPDPGVTGLSWRKLVPGSCWAGTRSHYNRWVHRSPCDPADEDLWANAGVAYRYASVIDFNYDHPVYGRGAGIFLHVEQGKPTRGCVSLHESDLVPILRWMRPGTRILIGTAGWLRSLRN
jgi:L,D-peptidoglycan transpeptidase YkuD (ErfK/YbiS/YcfS/YnhG family)